MSEKVNFNNKNVDLNENETEDGEINENISVDIKSNEDEIEHYYMSLNGLEADLRCNCCGDVFSDPVTLKCQHLMDRYCVLKKQVGNIIECFKCHLNTTCDDIDELLTDFNIASRIPPKPKLLISIINKHKAQQIKGGRRRKKNTLLNKDECLSPNKRRRKSRWSETEDNPQASVSGAIADILSSNNLPKNITMSQFKKYTEISSKSSIMKLLTKAVMQSVNSGEQKKNSRNVATYSDSEILEMIPLHELDELFEIEKTHFIILFKDALRKGVISPPSPNKTSKMPLLPTPKPNNKTVISPEHSKKCSVDSSDSDVSDKSSNISDVSLIFDSPELKSKTANNISKLSSLEITKEEKVPTKLKEQSNLLSNNLIPKVNDCTKMSNACLTESAQDNTIVNGSYLYKESVNRLHSIYSKMYHASIKMKEFENQLQSQEYHSAYNIYTENYSEYQRLYSSIQNAINIDSVVTENTDSNTNISDSNTINNKLTSVVNQEQASSTISPNVYAPDSTDSLNENKSQTNQQFSQNSNEFIGLSDIQKYRKQCQLDKKKKYGYLWISNLCKDTRATDLCKLFSNFGHVSKIKLFQYKAQTPVSFFSLIFMPNFSEAESAYKELQNTTLSNHQIQIRMLENDPLAEDDRSL